MGGIVDGGADAGIKTTPCHAAIEKAQEELRLEYDVREKRRRELEFLEKGGNPLDFKFGNAASVSVLSTSLVDRHKEQFVSGEAKVSLALTASTHGDSIESNGRPGVPTTCEQNSDDSLLNFNGGTEMPEVDKKSARLDRKNSIVCPDQSLKTDSNHSAKESEDSAIFRPYARRNRSRLNRDSGRSSSTDILNHRGSDGSSLPAPASIKDSRASTMDSSDLKESNAYSISLAELPDNNNELVSKSIIPGSGADDDGRTLESSRFLKKNEFLEVRVDTETRVDQHTVCLTDADQTFSDSPCKVIGISRVVEGAVSGDAGNLPFASSMKADSEMNGQLNSLSEIGLNNKTTVNEALNSCTAANSKAVDSESSCACSTEEVCIDPMNIDNGNVRVEKTDLAMAENIVSGVAADGHNNSEAIRDGADSKREDTLLRHCIVNVLTDQGVNKSCGYSTFGDREQTVDPIKEETELLADNTNVNQEICSEIKPNEPTKAAISEVSKSIPLTGVEDTGQEISSADNHSRLAAIVNEDSVLEEAKIIEEKHKRIAQLSMGTVAFEEHYRSRWGFVLEEMAWLANDFAQERLWKSTAASQLCHRAASASILWLERESRQINLRKVAFSLAKDVMQFWSSMEENSDVVYDNGNSDEKLVRVRPVDSGGNVDTEVPAGAADSDMGQGSINDMALHRKTPLRSYAVQFLKQTNSHVPTFHADSPESPDITSVSETLQVSWEDHLTEENLFYTIPSGAMETYRKLIESYTSEHEGTGNMQDADTHMSDVSDCGYQENAYNEGEGETGAYYLPGAFEGSKSLKLSQKKRKASIRPYELEADLPSGRCLIGTHQPMGKRPPNLVGHIPTKRFRSASRPRVLLPSGTPASVGSFQAPTKTDASSGDTSSFQDDLSTIPSALRIQKNGEGDSVGNYGNRLSHDMVETSIHTKKKKKPKYSSHQFDPGWQLDSPMLAEQQEQSKRSLENHLFESNGTSGLYEQPIIKKPKIMNHSADNSFDNVTTGSIPSSMALQSLSNPKKILKIFNGHDGGRKTKTIKMPLVQTGSGNSWSQFEDQALVVLVHDMGPNWELVSDSINSILQFKCIYRKSTECKERHKVLMDKTANDGHDNTEDSGSSQPYPSTLPGIPKGSARQLFQRLQGPVEEDVIREHFNKIIQIGQKQRYLRMQNESHDVKQMAVHTSHFVALSQVCPNNLNGVILTPLDLCEEASRNADILLPLGYQGSQGTNLVATNQGPAASVVSTSGAYSSPQGSCGPVHSPNLLLPSGPLNTPARDGRYNVQRPSVPLADDLHRGQQYSHMYPSRSIQQSKLPVSGAITGNNHGIRAFPNGNIIGVPTATNRNLPMSRPAFQGLVGPPAMNPSSVLSSSPMGTLNGVNLHIGSNSGQGTPLMRPQETFHSAKPVNNLEHQRQMMVSELQIVQGNSRANPPVNGLGSAFTNQATSPVSTFSSDSQNQHQIPPQPSPVHNRRQNPQLQGSNHSTGPQSQAYAIRLAKERQLQQRYMQHQQQQLASPGSLMPHAQPQSQLPLSPALQNSAQLPLQSPAQSISPGPLAPSSPINPMTPAHAQKIPMQTPGTVRNPHGGVGGLTNQVGKQRQGQLQQQQLQQSGRQHPQLRHSTPAQAHTKVQKGGGRGNTMAYQNLQNESFQINGISTAPGSFAGEKELMRGQGLPSSTNVHPAQQSKLLASKPLNHPQLPQSTCSETAPHLKFQQQQQPHSHPGNSNQVHVLPVSPGQNMPPSNTTTMGSNHIEAQLPLLTNKSQFSITQSIGPRMVPQNLVTHDTLIESQLDSKGDAKPNAVMVGTSKGTPLVARDSAGSTTIIWQASEPLYEAGIMNSIGQVGHSGNLGYAGTGRSDSLPSFNQSPGQRLKKDISALNGQSVGVIEEQWQQQPTHLKHSPVPTSSPPQQYHAGELVSQLEQKPSKELPLRSQVPHSLTIQGNSCIGHSNSEVE